MKIRHNQPEGSVVWPGISTRLKGRCHGGILATRTADCRGRRTRPGPSRGLVGGIRLATGGAGRLALEKETPPRLRTPRLPGRSLSRTRRLGGPMVLDAESGPGTARRHVALQSILHPLPWRRRPGRLGHPRRARLHRPSLAVVAFRRADRQYPVGRPRRRHADLPRDARPRRDVGDVPLSPQLRPRDRGLASGRRPCRRSERLRHLGIGETGVITGRRIDLGRATAPRRSPASYDSAMTAAGRRRRLDLHFPVALARFVGFSNSSLSVFADR